MISKIYLLDLILFLSLMLVNACSCGKSEGTPYDQNIKVDTSMLYIENDRLKLGVNLTLGGSITYLSDKANGGENMINSYDWGRQIQMSYYGGPCPYFGPNGERPAPEWEGFCWNPIQSGDCGGNRSKIVSYEKRGENAIFVRTIPMLWPFKSGIAAECLFECLYTLSGNVITMEATIVNQREDKTQYWETDQEMPAVYTNGPWYKLVTYLGDEPFADKPVTVIVDKNDKKGWPWVHFYTPENWVALLDDKGYGIGVFQPDVMRFSGGFHPNDYYKGFGGEKDGQTGYIAPSGKQILDHNIRWTYKTSLILGPLDEIRSYVKMNHGQNRNPEWVFANSREYWYYRGIKDSGFPIEGNLNLQFEKASSLISPETFWKTDDVNWLEIEGEFHSASGKIEITVEIQPVSKSDFTDWLNWSEGEFSVEEEKKKKASEFPEKPAIRMTQIINSDGIARTYRINLKEMPDYNGSMKNLKLIFSDNGTAKISRIRLVK